jgi:hypothetical protein
MPGKNGLILSLGRRGTRTDMSPPSVRITRGGSESRRFAKHCAARADADGCTKEGEGAGQRVRE